MLLHILGQQRIAFDVLDCIRLLGDGELVASISIVNYQFEAKDDLRLDLIESLRGQTTVMLSTHILADVERVCDTIGIISKGRMVIEARREELLERYALPIFEVEADDGLGAWPESVRQMPFVASISVSGRSARVLVNDIAAAKHELLASLVSHGLLIRRFEMVTPTLEDVFLRLTGDSPVEK